MRTGGTFNMTGVPSNATLAAAAASSHSPWHSPIPYLFGGLAAMLGLIAFALLILACSYWKLSSYLENTAAERDLENGDDEKKEGESVKVATVYEEKIVVIMAGDKLPSCIATPVTSRASSFGSDKSADVSHLNGNETDEEEKAQKSKHEEESSDHHHQHHHQMAETIPETQEEEEDDEEDSRHSNNNTQ